MNSTLKAESVSLSFAFFDSPSVKAIEKEFGFKGSKLLLDILLEVAKFPNTESVYCKSFRERIAFRNNVSERLVDMVVHRMVNNHLLRKIRHSSYYSLVVPSWCVQPDGINPFLSSPYFVTLSHENQVSSEETPINSEETTVSSEKTHDDSILTPKKHHYGTSKEAGS